MWSSTGIGLPDAYVDEYMWVEFGYRFDYSVVLVGVDAVKRRTM